LLSGSPLAVDPKPRSNRLKRASARLKVPEMMDRQFSDGKPAGEAIEKIFAHL
jgi:hypothetical protein